MLVRLSTILEFFLASYCYIHTYILGRTSYINGFFCQPWIRSRNLFSCLFACLNRATAFNGQVSIEYISNKANWKYVTSNFPHFTGGTASQIKMHPFASVWYEIGLLWAKITYLKSAGILVFKFFWKEIWLRAFKRAIIHHNISMD